MSVTVLRPSARVVQTAESYTVYVRQHWYEAWTEEPYLRCNWLCWTAGPKLASAELEWIYGEVLRPGETSFAVAEYRSLGDWYVKIVVTQYDDDGDTTTPLAWYGVIQEDGDNPHGTREVAGERIPRGRQMLLAYGLECLLDLDVIREAWFFDSTDPEERRERQWGRGVKFNADHRLRPASGVDKKKHDELPGNRSEDRGEAGAYLFAADWSAGEVWTVREIVRYLLVYHSPRDSSGDVIVPFRLDTLSEGYLPDFGRPEIETDGRRPKEIIDQAIDRRRLLGYTFEVSPEGGDFGEDIVILRAFNFLDSPLPMPDGSDSMPANGDQYALDLDLTPPVESIHLKESATDLCDQVIAEGGWIVCCGTISSLDSTLVAHWSAAQETAYETAASTAEGYAALDVYERDERNAMVRADDRYERVFSYFGLPRDWDGQVGDGEGGTLHPLFPYEDLEYDPSPDAEQKAWYLPELRLLSRLPLKTCHDYSGSHILLDDVPDNTPEGHAWEYRPIYALLRLVDRETVTENGEGTVRYAEIGKMSAAADVELLGLGAGRDLSGSVRVQDDGPGVAVRIHGGSDIKQYDLAGSDFTPLDGTGVHDPTYDWRDNLLVTIAVEAGRRVEAAWPETVDVSRDFLRVKRIDASSRCGLHYVAPGTVVECQGGKLVRTTEGGFVRNDRHLLQQLARTAYEWYGRSRQAFTFSIRGAWGRLKVGDLITTLGSGGTEEAVRSVVTEVRIDFARSDRDTHRTTVQTQWAELDTMRLL